MTVRVRVDGLKDLQRKLRRLDDKQVEELSQGPVDGAAHVLRRAIADKAPRRTGQLAESIDVLHDDDIDHAHARVGTRDAGFHGLFLEFGWTDPSGTRQRARPFMRPAYESVKGQVQRTAVDGIRKAIERRVPNL